MQKSNINVKSKKEEEKTKLNVNSEINNSLGSLNLNNFMESNINKKNEPKYIVNSNKNEISSKSHEGNSLNVDNVDINKNSRMKELNAQLHKNINKNK